jgi:hypothetical protein
VRIVIEMPTSRSGYPHTIVTAYPTPEEPDMRTTVEGKDYPALLYLLYGYLYEEADSILSLLEGYVRANGRSAARTVVDEIDSLLGQDYTDQAATELIEAHCLYLVEGSGKETLKLIMGGLKQILKATSG